MLSVEEADKIELRYCGMLGHTIVVLTDGGGKLESCDLNSARRYAKEEVARNPRIYKKTRKGWRRV